MSDAATFELRSDSACGVLVVGGEVDLLTAPVLRRRLESALTQFDDVIVDMSGVTFFSSAGVDVLASRDMAGGASLALVDPAPPVRRALDILGWPPHLELSADTPSSNTLVAGAVHA